jgi:hypothetical protein
VFKKNIFTLTLFTIKLKLKSVILIFNKENREFKAFKRLFKLLIKGLINLKVLNPLFYTFILKLFKASFNKLYKVFF